MANPTATGQHAPVMRRLRSQHWAAIVWGLVTVAIGAVLVADLGWGAAIFWTLFLVALWVVFAFWSAGIASRVGTQTDTRFADG
jgi:hypothetical protein